MVQLIQPISNAGPKSAVDVPVGRLTSIVMPTIIWCLFVSMGWYVLADYSNAPGDAAKAPIMWPAQSRIKRSAEQATLVMFLHPKCPCSRASVEELSRLMASAGRRMKTCVVFTMDISLRELREQHIHHVVGKLPGIDLVHDRNGVEASLFGARTSGAAMLFDAEGKLVFEGGITAARGHIGDNSGRAAITNWLICGTTTAQCTPVFGCPLQTPGETPNAEDRR